MKRFFQNPLAIILILFMTYTAVFSGRYDGPMDWLISTLLFLPGILIGLSFHEFGHAFVAWKCGDDTPRLQGRVTTNPIAHIDPIGFIALLFIGFGWGKPVMVNPNNFKKMRRDELLVDLAGVTMNLILAVAFTGIWRLLAQFFPELLASSMGSIVNEIVFNVVYINIVLMVFNLLPVPPLDGFNVVTEIFNLRNTSLYYTIYNNGFLILMLLILFDITDRILTPAVIWCFDTLVMLFF